MKMLNAIQRSIKIALSNLWRNKLLSASTLLIITLILFIFHVILTIHLLIESGITELNRKVDIIIYLKDDTEYLTIQQMVYEIKKYPEVEDIIYTSKEQAINTLLQKYPERVDPFEEYGIKNPLPASITIISKNPNDHRYILQKLTESKYSIYFKDQETNEENDEIIEKLISITNFTKNLLITIIISFGLGATMIIMNALHLTIQSRKDEIIIQKLVGAKINFIRLPFIIEGIIYGLLSGLISGILIYIFFKKTNILSFEIETFTIRFYELMLIQFIFCIAISIIASILAIHRYLKNV